MPPQTHGFVITSTGHSLAVWAPVHSKNLILVPGKVVEELTRPQVPNLDCGVFGARREEPRIGREGTLVDSSNVAPKGTEPFSVSEGLVSKPNRQIRKRDAMVGPTGVKTTEHNTPQTRT